MADSVGPAIGLTVVLFSRPGCHLCDQAASILDILERTDGLTWRRVDIESDSSLLERYQLEIPVIQIDGGDELKWPTTLERVRRATRSRRPW